MGTRKRGRERLVNCDSCGRRVPRDKSVSFSKMTTFSTELRNADDVKSSIFREAHYCISCGKHRKIFEKKKRQAANRREQEERY